MTPVAPRRRSRPDPAAACSTKNISERNVETVSCGLLPDDVYAESRALAWPRCDSMGPLRCALDARVGAGTPGQNFPSLAHASNELIRERLGRELSIRTCSKTSGRELCGRLTSCA
jgi:hypothetical protein